MLIEEQESNLFSHVPFGKIVGVILIILALVALGWVLVETYQLYKYGQAFLLTDKLIPKTIPIMMSEETDNRLYLPREIFVYGIPLWILGLAVQVGVALLKAGTQYFENRSTPTKI
jgi:hypothetical protein